MYKKENESLSNRNRKVAIDGIVDQAVKELRSEQHDLYDFYHYCRRQVPDFFRHMSIEKFKRWNDQRLATLGDTAPPVNPPVTDINSLGNRILVSRVVAHGGFDDDTMSNLTELKNALCDDLRGQDDETVSKTLQTEMDDWIANQPARIGLSKLAQTHQQNVKQTGGYR